MVGGHGRVCAGLLLGARSDRRSDGIPLGLVTHIERGYVGSVLLIDNDLEAHPQYTPYISALWVEPEHRRQGVAAALIRAARDEAARLGHVTCYHCAAPKMAPCYLSRCFHLLETDVESLNVLAA